MPKLDLDNYVEKKQCPRRMVLWRLVNFLVFPITTHRIRKWLMRKFGAKIGGFCAVYPTVQVYAPWNLVIGSHVCLGPRVDVYCKDRIEIGNQVVVSQGAYLCSASHDISSCRMELETSPIVIGNQVWIGAKATILPGVIIGDGAVVGACAVVAKDVPPWSVVVGNPARIVGRRELKND